MRMKFNKLSQLVLAAAFSLTAAGLLTACSTLTADFVYVTSALATGSNQYGQVDVFEVNQDSGRMRKIPASPFPSGGRNPVADAPAPDNASLYVVNEDDNSIVQFIIGNDGKLYPNYTTNTPGVFPFAIAPVKGYLYVLDTYQPLPTCNSASPCSGSVGVFPINKDDSLGAAISNTSNGTSYWPLTLPASPNDVIVPTGIATGASGAYVYVTAYDSSVSPTVGYVFGFSVNSDGSLAPVNGGTPFAAGTHPSAVAGNPAANDLYVTDMGPGNILGFQINAGMLTPLSGSPYPSGNQPVAIVVDGKGRFAYAANSLDANVTAYTINAGNLTRVGAYTTGAQPVALGIDPYLNQYLYTANFLGNTVSGFQINSTDGTLLIAQFSPFKSNTNPTAVAAIPHPVPIPK